MDCWALCFPWNISPMRRENYQCLFLNEILDGITFLEVSTFTLTHKLMREMVGLAITAASLGFLTNCVK